MNDKTRKLLFDVLDSGRAIRHRRTGRTFVAFRNQSIHGYDSADDASVCGCH
jgi:hypothetical protein